MRVRRARTCAVYRLTNEITGEFYVGKALDLTKRLEQHFKQLAAGIHPNPRIQASYAKHGRAAFIVDVVEICQDSRTLYLREWAIIGELRPPFNLSGPHLPGPRAGHKYPGHSVKMKAYWRRIREKESLMTTLGMTILTPKKTAKRKRGEK